MAIAFVAQHASGVATSGSSIIITNGATATTIGNVVVIGITCNASQTVSTVVDSAGNTYLKAGECVSGVQRIEQWYVKTTAQVVATTGTFTVTFGGAVTICAASASSYSGFTSGPFVDNATVAASSSSSGWVGTHGPNKANCLIVGFECVTNAVDTVNGATAALTVCSTSNTSCTYWMGRVVQTTRTNIVITDGQWNNAIACQALLVSYGLLAPYLRPQQRVASATARMIGAV